MKFLSENLGFGINEIILLEEAHKIIKNRKGRTINFKSKKRKGVVLKVLNFYNLSFVEKDSKSNIIIIGDYYCNVLFEKTQEVTVLYKEIFREKVKNTLDKFCLNNSGKNSDIRLNILYDFLKEINLLFDNGNLHLKLKSISKNKKKFILFSTHFYIFIKFLILAHKRISLSDLTTFSDISEKLNDKNNEINYNLPIIKSILDADVIYLNIIRTDLNIEKNLIQIPKAIQIALDSFETNLRNFLLKNLLNNFTRPIKNHFNNFPDLRRNVIDEMKRSKKSSIFIEKFRRSNYENKNDLKWLFEQMMFSHYAKFISKNSFIRNFFKNLNYEEDLREISKLRNIPAHIKTEAKRNISMLISKMYIYERIFKR